MAFSTKIKGHHHLQGNVQVYHVRIPVKEGRPAPDRLSLEEHDLPAPPTGAMSVEGRVPCSGCLKGKPTGRPLRKQLLFK